MRGFWGRGDYPLLWRSGRVFRSRGRRPVRRRHEKRWAGRVYALNSIFRDLLLLLSFSRQHKQRKPIHSCQNPIWKVLQHTINTKFHSMQALGPNTSIEVTIRFKNLFLWPRALQAKIFLWIRIWSFIKILWRIFSKSPFIALGNYRDFLLKESKLADFGKIKGLWPRCAI